MELRHLRYFVAVAELEHFRRAAEKLSIAQPALSRQIQALERELGVSLFERMPAGARLSAAGRAFLDDARRILREVVQAGERARRVASGQTARLCVSFTEASSSCGVVPESILAFQTARPEVKLSLMPLESPAQLEGLRARRIDAAFLHGLGDADANIATQPMQVESIVLAVRAGHPLAAATELRLADLAGEPLILIARAFNPQLYDELMVAFKRAGVSPRIVQEVNTSAVILNFVAVGVGSGIVTSAMRGRLPAGVVLKQVWDLSMPYRLDLAWRRDNKCPALYAFVEIALAILRRAEPEPALDIS